MTGPGCPGVSGFFFFFGSVCFAAEEMYGMQDGAVHPEAIIKLKASTGGVKLHFNGHEIFITGNKH